MKEMSGAGRNRLLSNDTVIQWYNQYGLVGCANKIVEITPEETRGETELRSLKGRISYLVSSFKRIKGAEERKQTLAKEFVASQRKGINNNNNNNNPAEDLTHLTLKDPAYQKELRPRRAKQVTGSEVDEDSNDSSDGLTARRRGNAARVNYNVKDLTANNKVQLVHDAEGRLVGNNGLDLCDCLDISCPGCHYPCLKCESAKCGSECRSRRKWLYEHVLVEGTELKVKNPANETKN